MITNELKNGISKLKNQWEPRLQVLGFVTKIRIPFGVWSNTQIPQNYLVAHPT